MAEIIDTPPKEKIETTKLNKPPHMLRKMLPVVAFVLTFAAVMSALLVYMDATAVRHHQFRVNMTQDYDMSVAQDNPQLITYIRQVHIKPSSPEHGTNNVDDYERVPTDMERTVASLLDNKTGGLFFEALRHGRPSNTEWLERNLSWSGVLVQTYPPDFFYLLKRGRPRTQLVHACLSGQPHPKEISIPQDGVKINSVFSEESDLFHTRIKCFPLYSLMLAANTTKLDFLSLDTECSELDVLETLPFEAVQIQAVSVRVAPCGNMQPDETALRKFFSANYRFVKQFGDDQLFVLKQIKV